MAYARVEGLQEAAFYVHGRVLAATATRDSRARRTPGKSEAFFKSTEKQVENNPYTVMFASGDWTCTIAKWKGKIVGQPRTVARWTDGEIVKEHLFYDQVGFVRQIGVL